MALEGRTYRVGSRASELALWQAKHVIGKLEELHPERKFEIVTRTTHGDRVLDKPLSELGGKGVFTKELDTALLEKDVDFVVHSMKDLPTVLPDGIVMCAVPSREDRADAVVLNPKHSGKSLATLPEDAVIGSSSIRRRSTISSLHSKFQFKDIRGNLNTRVRKLDEGHEGIEFDAIILACAGLLRLGWGDRIAERLDVNKYLYAPAQGALAVVCREGDNDVATMLTALDCQDTKCEISAERAFMKEMEGGCKVPLAVSCELLDQDRIRLTGQISSQESQKSVRDTVDGRRDDVEKVGRDLAAKMKANGGAEILAEIAVERQ